MKKFRIIASKSNIYTGQVKKLKNESKLPTEILYIEDLIEDKIDLLKVENSIVYFLCCNSPLVPKAIEKIEKYSARIINKDYLENNYQKLYVQELLQKNGIKIPTIYSYDENMSINFPIICKENKHEGIIVQVYNMITLTRLFSKFNSKDFYLEDSIEKHSEIKVYFVGEKAFLREAENKDKELDEICKKISIALDDLEVFSADIIQNVEGENFVIDVNPAAGFYLSNDGRKYFLNELTKK